MAIIKLKDKSLSDKILDCVALAVWVIFFLGLLGLVIWGMVAAFIHCRQLFWVLTCFSGFVGGCYTLAWAADRLDK